MNNKTINYILLIIIFLLLLLIKQNKKETFLNLGHSDFKKVYPKYNIIYDKTDNSIRKNNKNAITRRNLNTEICRKIINNKHNTMTELKKHNIPIPKSIIFKKDTDSINDLIKKMKINKINYPIVIKPINGTQGKDVNVGIKTKKELNKIINNLKKYKKLQVQEEIKGENYRILVVNNKIIDILQRETPYVIGDGKLTIQELIDNRNKKQLKDKKHTTYLISETYIKEQGYDSLKLIPNKNKKIYITNTIGYHNGSNIKRYPINKVHPDNLKMFLKTMRVLNCNISGIDYITSDLEKSYRKEGAIIELNSGPHYEIHRYKNKPLYISNKITNQLSKYYDNIVKSN